MFDSMTALSRIMFLTNILSRCEASLKKSKNFAFSRYVMASEISFASALFELIVAKILRHTVTSCSANIAKIGIENCSDHWYGLDVFVFSRQMFLSFIEFNPFFCSSTIWATKLL